MTKTARNTAARVGMAVVLLAAASNASAGDDATIVIHVENYSELSSKSLAKAEAEASRIYANAGLRTEWLHDGATSSEPGRALHLTVIVLSPEMAARMIAASPVVNNALGRAARATSRAYIFYDRVEALSIHRQIAVNSILGKVIAHELGHLILPEYSHSAAGIMRADLNLQERVQRFTPEQSTSMRTVLTSDERIAG